MHIRANCLLKIHIQLQNFNYKNLLIIKIYKKIINMLAVK